MRRFSHIATLGNMTFAVMILRVMTLGVMMFGICAPRAFAQRGFTTPHFAFNRGHAANPAFQRAGAFLYPFLPADGYYADALNTGYPVPSQPIVILQAPPPATAPVAETHPGEPVLIELQGDQYVRMSGPAPESSTLAVQPSGRAEASQPTRSHAQAGEQASSAQQKPVHQESVVLVFRDGHREDVSDYVISNGTLYAHTSYYSSGAWTKNIDLATLDVPETISYNQSRGVRFQLPKAANEVVVGP